jgi:hypothetical protein
VREHPAVSIQGDQGLLSDEFGTGVPITQTFQMKGGGLTAIDVSFRADEPVDLLLSCELSRMDVTRPGAEISLHAWPITLKRVSGTEWRRLTFPPIALSNGETYVLRLRLVDAVSPGDRRLKRAHAGARTNQPRVAVTVSADNVSEGGSLWIGQTRQVGSLSIRAFTGTRTTYQQFSANVATTWPPVWRMLSVQIAIALVYQLALLALVYLVLIESAENPRSA